MKKKKAKIIIPIMLMILIMIMGGSYAWLSQTISGTKNNIIRAGSLLLTLEEEEGINLENAYPLTNVEGSKLKGYTFTLKNNSKIANDYEIYLDDSEISIDNSQTESTKKEDNTITRIPDNKLNYSITKNGGVGKVETLSNTQKESGRLLDAGTLGANQNNRYTLKIWINESAGTEISGNVFSARLRVEVSQAKINENILVAYNYQDDRNQYNYCVTGEEATCVKTTCYEPKDQNSCTPGTIIKYRVNNTMEKYFYVLHDDGLSLTLQDRDNTVESSIWSSTNTSSGPQAILAQLQNVVSSWQNVNSLNYTLGEQKLIENNFTACTSYNDCSLSPYQLKLESSKARIISVQEAVNAGCTATTCPKWLYNYLTGCTNSGCSNDYTNNVYGYWTLSANAINNSSSWTIANNGSLTPINIKELRAARAVIEIYK